MSLTSEISDTWKRERKNTQKSVLPTNFQNRHQKMFSAYAQYHLLDKIFIVMMLYCQKFVFGSKLNKLTVLNSTFYCKNKFTSQINSSVLIEQFNSNTVRNPSECDLINVSINENFS